MPMLTRTLPISYRIRNRSRECGDHELKTKQIKPGPLLLTKVGYDIHERAPIFRSPSFFALATAGVRSTGAWPLAHLAAEKVGRFALPSLLRREIPH